MNNDVPTEMKSRTVRSYIDETSSLLGSSATASKKGR